MELLIINMLSIILVVFIAHGLYILTKKDEMTEEGRHHIQSHLYLASMMLVGAVFMSSGGSIVFLVVSMLFVLAHLLKENLRIERHEPWTKDYHWKQGDSDRRRRSA